MTHRSYSAWIVAASMLAALACEEKQQSDAKPAPSARADSGAPHAAGVDKNIAEAVAEVAGGTAPGMENAPPASGVFAPGTADKEIRMGDPPKIALGGKGDGPTARFGTVAPKKKFDAKVVVAVQMGPRSAMPTVEVSVSMDPPQAPAEGADKPAATETVLRVTGAKLPSDQPGELPPGLDKQISKVKGSKYHFQFGPNGGARLANIEVSKDADSGLVPVLAAAGEALSIAFAPYPAEPVGAGAFWMVTSRESFLGLDVVSYRMMKLQKVDGDHATLGVSTRYYVVSGQLGFPGLPPHTVAEYNQTGNGSIAVSVAQPSLVQGEDTDTLLANLSVAPKDVPQGMPPGQPLPLRFDIRTKFVMGGG